MSVAVTIVLVWIAASLVVAVGWMLVALYVRRRRETEEHAVREWRQLQAWLAHPHLPRQRSGRRKRGA